MTQFLDQPISRQNRPDLQRRAPSAAAADLSDEAANLLVDAKSFMRLGLINEAIELLSGALRRDPSLRALREPLMRLYATDRQYPRAIDELWVLLAQAESPRDEARFLSYILRLGGNNPSVERRLKELYRRTDARPTQSQDGHGSLSSIDALSRQLRVQLLRKRSPLLCAQTSQEVRKSEPAKPPGEEPPRAAAVTNPGGREVDAMAEELALSCGGLQQQLNEIKTWVQERRYTEAMTRLQALAQRFPHSRQVRFRLAHLQLELAKTPVGLKPRGQVAQKPRTAPNLHSVTTMPNWVFSTTSQVPTRPPVKASATATRPVMTSTAAQRRSKTQEIAPEDIEAEYVLPPTPPSFAQPPPPPPSKSARPTPPSEAARFYRIGTTLRSFGQIKQAIELLKRVGEDPVYGARAAILLGLCHRDTKQLDAAVQAFMRGISLPISTEAVLCELFFELGRTHEQRSDTVQALRYYELSLGTTGFYRDALHRIARLQGPKAAPQG